tara:strand:- start:4716 stop:4907 length:192 start_codon:yes stop_codon:yes gene_type:complete
LLFLGEQISTVREVQRLFAVTGAERTATNADHPQKVFFFVNAIRTMTEHAAPIPFRLRSGKVF